MVDIYIGHKEGQDINWVKSLWEAIHTFFNYGTTEFVEPQFIAAVSTLKKKWKEYKLIPQEDIDQNTKEEFEKEYVKELNTIYDTYFTGENPKTRVNINDQIPMMSLNENKEAGWKKNGELLSPITIWKKTDHVVPSKLSSIKSRDENCFVYSKEFKKWYKDELNGYPAYKRWKEAKAKEAELRRREEELQRRKEREIQRVRQKTQQENNKFHNIRESTHSKITDWVSSLEQQPKLARTEIYDDYYDGYYDDYSQSGTSLLSIYLFVCINYIHIKVKYMGHYFLFVGDLGFGV